MDNYQNYSPVGGDDDEEARRRAAQQRGAPGAASVEPQNPTAGVGVGGQPGAPAGPTFAQLQRQGYARPAMPNRGADLGGGMEDARGNTARSMSRIAPQQAGGAPSQPPPPAMGRAPRPGVVPGNQPGGQNPNLTTDFGQILTNMFMNRPGQSQFGGSAPSVSAPTYKPGAGPMDMPGGSPNVPGAYNPAAFKADIPDAFSPGGFKGAYEAQDSPLLRATGDFEAGGSGMGGDIGSALANQLKNPSSFNSDAVQGMFNRLSGQIDDEYTTRDRYLQEDMAKRGLAESSIRGGRMADLNVEKRSAKTELADRLLEKMAQTGSADSRAAIAQAMGYDESLFGRGLQGYQAQMGANQQNFGQDLASRAFAGDQNAMALTQNLGIQGFNNQAGQQGYQNQLQNQQFGMNVADFNRAGGQMGFQNQMQGAQMQNQFANDLFGRQLNANQFNQGLGQSAFNNALQGANFNAGQNQQQYQNQLTNFQANLGANQQNFNQGQALLASLLGFKQQGFENEMQKTQFESDVDFRNRQLAAAMASLGL